jgi:hypothetical protein
VAHRLALLPRPFAYHAEPLRPVDSGHNRGT